MSKDVVEVPTEVMGTREIYFLDISIKFGGFLIIFVLLVAAGLYLSVFNNGLSNDADSWSAFGSYFGGILGPLVSLVTLLAVLKTVYLQRELLSAQKQEFERMSDLQRKTFNSQQDQMKIAAKDALELKIAAAQDSAIKTIEMLISTQEKDYDRYSEMTYGFRNEFREEIDNNPDGNRGKKLNRIIKCRDRARFAVGLLSARAYGMAIGRFASVEAVRRRLESEVTGIYKELDSKFPVDGEKKPEAS